MKDQTNDLKKLPQKEVNDEYLRYYYFYVQICGMLRTEEREKLRKENYKKL